MSQHPFDPGLQPERTVLAWQRTALSIGTGSLVFARIEASVLGIWSWAFAGAGLLAAVLIATWSRRRYAYTHHTLVSGGTHLADGLLHAVVAVIVVLTGTAALILSLLT